MSKTVDERVVEMRFDNKQFESNVQTSMSTIEKLKQSLNLTGASKGLENVSAAAKKCDMSGLSGAVETVHLKFSALEVMALRVLNNIADSAYNAGKRVVSALTIDPVKTGFQEYETQINAIQTILANTESKGSTLQDVNAALDELNHYADMTIYNFTEMTRNIGTFTAAGVDLDTSVSAIKGIANLAAVSGSTSQQASTAMYQLSQALASGTVKLMDWNSVVNAGMGGQVFQDALKETARVHNIAIDDMIKEEGSFRETLSKGWLTSEILTETLSKFTGDLTESQLQQMGYTEEQVESILKMGQTANDAATKVKTLTQLYDTLKEAAQSGWTKTWELIVGDFDHAKELYTTISDTVSGYLNGVSDKRNALLQDTLYNNYQKLTSEINKAGIETNKFEEAAKKTLTENGFNAEKLIEHYGSLEKVFKSGHISGDILKETIKNLKSELVDLSGVTAGLSNGSTGDNVKKIQEALNGLGYDVGDKGIDGIIGSDTEAALKAFQEAQGLEQTGIVDDATLSALKEASSSTAEFSDNINDLIDNVTELGGREKIIESFKNIFKFLGEVIKPVKEAFREIFPPTTSEQLGSAIDKFKLFTEGLKVSEETADKIKRTFKGLFSVFSLLGKAASAIVSPIVKFFNSGVGSGIVDWVLSITASIGNFFTELSTNSKVTSFFSDLSSNISEALSVAAGYIKPIFEDILEWVTDNVTVENAMSLWETYFPKVSKVVGNAVSNIYKKFKTIFSWLKENFSENAGGKGIQSFGDIFSTVAKIISNAGNDIWDGVKFAFSWASENLHIDNISNAFKKLGETFSSAWESISGTVKKIYAQIEPVVTWMTEHVWATLGGVFTITKIKNNKKIGELFDTLKEGLEGLFGVHKKTSKASTALLKIAAAILMLAISFEKISKLSEGQIITSLTTVFGIIVELVGALAIASAAVSNVNLSDKGIGKIGTAFLLIAVAVRLLVKPIEAFKDLSPDQIGNSLVTLGGALGIISYALYKLSQYGNGGSVLKSGAGIFLVAASLSAITKAIKTLGEMDTTTLTQGGLVIAVAIGYFALILKNMATLSKDSSSAASAGGGILLAALALIPIVAALKILGTMKLTEEVLPALVSMGGALLVLGGVLTGMSRLTKGGTNPAVCAAALLVASLALIPIAAALWTLSRYDWDDIWAGMAGLSVVIVSLGAAIAIIGNFVGGKDAILAAVGLLVGSVSLEIIADSLTRLASADWKHMLAAFGIMETVFVTLGAAIGILGSKLVGGTSSILAGIGLLVGSASLEVIADALTRLASADWQHMDQAFLYMEGVFATLAVAIGVLGSPLCSGGFGALLGAFALLVGSVSLELVADALVDLCECITILAGLPEEDIEKGLTTLGKLMSETALGGLKNTFSGIGAGAIADMAPALKSLAESMESWKDVSIPDGLGEDLGELGEGVKAFNFTELFGGIDAFSQTPAILSDLAGAIEEWAGLSIPSNLGADIKSLGEGVKAFNLTKLFGGIDAFSQTPDILIDLATAISKWTDLSIPGDLGNGIQELGKGIQSFNLAEIFGGIDAFTKTPTALYQMATAVKNWEGVTVPDNIESDLDKLSEGVKKFNFSGWGASAIAECAVAIGELADSVRNWTGVSVGDDIITSLNGLSESVYAWSIIDPTNLKENVEPAGDLGEALQTWNGLTICVTKDNLEGLATGLAEFNDTSTGNIEDVCTGIGQLGTAVTNLGTVDFSTATSAVNNFAFAIQNVHISTDVFKNIGETAVSNFTSTLSGSSESLSTAGGSMMNSVAAGVTLAVNNLNLAVSSAIESAISTAEEQIKTFESIGSGIADKLRSGVCGKPTAISDSTAALTSAGENRAKDYYNNFYNVGVYLVTGFVNGMNSRITTAANKAAEMAKAASDAAQNKLIIKSPSRVFYKIGAYAGQGFVNALSDYRDVSYSAGASIAQSAKDGIGKAITKVTDSFGDSMDNGLTIRPVLDLSAVESGITQMNSMFGTQQTIGVESNIGVISSMMSERQSGNDDVVYAINKLGKGLNNLDRPSYNINGVTYDNGSEIAEAVGAIVRAAQIERRR